MPIGRREAVGGAAVRREPALVHGGRRQGLGPVQRAAPICHHTVCYCVIYSEATMSSFISVPHLAFSMFAFVNNTSCPPHQKAP